ncbi:MAG TPA: clostripain-related cysteine peptidase [Pyrinomonadaceae bacterium]|nr:clostripain-related cysteine peptidase [Pyrinomonadaceae bacterium]
MTEKTAPATKQRETKEFTLMFYFASDNMLAPGIVSQLKALKQAGYHHNSYVVAQFDPHTVGTPTHFFDVHHLEKLKHPGTSQVGVLSCEPSALNMFEDKLWGDEQNLDGVPIREQIAGLLAAENKSIVYDAPEPDFGTGGTTGARSGGHEEPDPRRSLEAFLKFCGEQYPARHYLLFILGHGLVVGNDVFLYDEHAGRNSLKLKELGEVLRTFKGSQMPAGSSFDLVSFHSCSVSSLEVAYELQETASYMLAAQGPTFVGSWPYRQVLTRVFNDLNALERGGKPVNVEATLSKIFNSIFHNSTDFLLAGYSFDLCLCDLRKVGALTVPLQKLSLALSDEMGEPLLRDLVMLAHLKSQSYWSESYTDLLDFCVCLSRQCDAFKAAGGNAGKALARVKAACQGVVEEWKKGDGLIVRSAFVGPAYQYSHGLSVFFPWTEPSLDNPLWWPQTPDDPPQGEYAEYEFKQTYWREFLLNYFEKTMRAPHEGDCEACPPRQSYEPEGEKGRLWRRRRSLHEDMASLVYFQEGRAGSDSVLSRKTNALDPTGDDCSCPSIKNFPRDTRPRPRRAGKNFKAPCLISHFPAPEPEPDE